MRIKLATFYGIDNLFGIYYNLIEQNKGLSPEK